MALSGETIEVELLPNLGLVRTYKLYMHYTQYTILCLSKFPEGVPALFMDKACLGAFTVMWRCHLSPQEKRPGLSLFARSGCPIVILRRSLYVCFSVACPSEHHPARCRLQTRIGLGAAAANVA